jgi:hypothetical protein
MAEIYQAKVVCILGMHRSGTSCLAGSLEERGLFLGDVINFATFNRRGNKESPEIMQINNDLLTLNGGSWDNPPEEMRWNDELRTRRDKHIASLDGRPIWGFKDPRTVFTLPFWQEALPDMHYVATFRHPFAVARSLQRRGPNLQPAIAPLELWMKYNRKLLQHITAHDIPLVNFDWPADVYGKAVDYLARHFGVSADTPAESPFYEQSLRTSDGHAGMPQSLGPKVSTVYEELLDRAMPISEIL